MLIYPSHASFNQESLVKYPKEIRESFYGKRINIEHLDTRCSDDLEDSYNDAKTFFFEELERHGLELEDFTFFFVVYKDGRKAQVSWRAMEIDPKIKTD